MGAFKTFDADQVSVFINGIEIKGYADGEFLRIEQEGADFSDVVGTDGEVTRSKTNDRRASVTLLLMQSSESNATLSALRAADLAAPNGAGVGAFLVTDRQGTSVYQADECWISQGPNVSFDREATTREWAIRLAQANMFTGGN